MPSTFTMPKLSPTMEHGTLTKWHKKENEFVEAGELLIEVATDKATVEHNTLDAGWLRKILIKEGEEAVVNQAIAIFTEERDESIEGYKPEGEAAAAPPLPAAAPEARGAAIPVFEAAEGGIVGAAESSPALRASSEPVFAPEPPLERYDFALPGGLASASGERIVASPLARKLAEEGNLDLSTISGSGPAGRIVSSDLVKAQPLAAAAFGRHHLPKIAPGTFQEETPSPMRKVIAQRLQEAKSFIPHFYVEQSVDAAALVAAREQLATFSVKISVNDFIVRACALALREHPGINSGFSSKSRTFVRFKTIDICVAVSVDGGLITPIVRHADYKNLGEISAEVRGLAQRARAGKLAPHEYKGGSFTISNLGMHGVTSFQAIINPPQAAILAVGAILDEPVVRGGSLAAGKVMRLTLSCDHRVIDGALAAEFLKSLKKYLESPAILLI